VTFLRLPDGVRLYYELHGPEGAAALVLLEGMGGDVPGWRRNIPHLAREFRVVTFDLRGNGLSDKPDLPMSMDTFVDDTAALMDSLGIARANLYGMSFGGMVAIWMSLTRPERVCALVLAATHAGPARASRAPASGRVPKGRPYLSLYSPDFAREHPDHVAEDLAVGRRNPQPTHAGRRQWEAMQSFDAWDRLGEIEAPTLVLHGTEDRLVAVDNARRLASGIPGARLRLLEGAGHVYHSEQPDEADLAVVRFLEQAGGCDG